MSYCPHCGKEIKDLPVPAATSTAEKDPNVSPKSRLLAMLLGIFCGSVGVHNFYLGRKKEGLLQAILFGAGITIFYVSYFVFIFTMAFNADKDFSNTSQAAAIFVFFFFGIMGALACIYYCTISALVQWIKIARGYGYDGNGLPVKNWNC